MIFVLIFWVLVLMTGCYHMDINNRVDCDDIATIEFVVFYEPDVVLYQWCISSSVLRLVVWPNLPKGWSSLGEEICSRTRRVPCKDSLLKELFREWRHCYAPHGAHKVEGAVMKPGLEIWLETCRVLESHASIKDCTLPGQSYTANLEQCYQIPRLRQI